MLLYLVQHGEALSKEENSERPLSATGEADVRKVAKIVSASRIISDSLSVLHSGKLRARQTAEIITGVLGVPLAQNSSGLKPKDDPGPWEQRLYEEDNDLMLVGHLPFMNRLASLLLDGDPEEEIVSFRMGGMVALKRANDFWSLQWYIIPELIP